MGAVYLAEHTLLGRPAAIKVLLREMSHHQELVSRFFNEARAATAVKHPGIVEIYDFGYHSDGSAYIVMEFLEGDSLATRLHHAGRLPEARAIALARQILGALGAAHAKGIVHRDLKPDNIFIVRDPDVADGERTKILDFGIAKLTSEAPGASSTRTGMVMGTPSYMSPEQCKGSGKVDHRADLYAMGCILHEMVCGRPPFVAEGAGEVLAQHIFAQVQAPSAIAAVSPSLEQVILRALDKNPDQRFRTAEEMAAALLPATPFAHAAAPTVVGGYPGAGGSFPASPTPPPVSSRPGLGFAASPLGMIATPAHGLTPSPLAPQTTMTAAAGATSTARERPARKRRPGLVVVVVAGALAGAVGGIAVLARGGDAAPTIDTSQPATVMRPEATAENTAAPPSSAVTPRAPTPPSPTPSAGDPPPAAAPTTHGAPAKPATITIKVASTPPGAEVYRMPQGVRIGTTPLDVPLDATPGEIVLILKRRGYRDETIALPADHDGDKTVALVRLPSRAPASSAPAEPEATDFFTRTPAPATTGSPPPRPAAPAAPAAPSKADGSIDPFAKPGK